MFSLEMRLEQLKKIKIIFLESQFTKCPEWLSSLPNDRYLVLLRKSLSEVYIESVGNSDPTIYIIPDDFADAEILHWFLSKSLDNARLVLILVSATLSPMLSTLFKQHTHLWPISKLSINHLNWGVGELGAEHVEV